MIEVEIADLIKTKFNISGQSDDWAGQRRAAWDEADPSQQLVDANNENDGTTKGMGADRWYSSQYIRAAPSSVPVEHKVASLGSPSRSLPFLRAHSMHLSKRCRHRQPKRKPIAFQQADQAVSAILTKK
jgi:hypothetical protein